jgi:hypothetical protein
MGCGPAGLMSNNYTLFKGKEAILKAYRFNKVAPWAVVVDRIPMFSYEGDDLSEGEDYLEQVLDNLKDAMGNGTYQLRVYREVPAKGIVNSTPFNFGFKFQLLDDEEFESRSIGGSSIAALKKRIEQLESGGGDEEEEDKSFGARVGRMFEHPQVQEFVMQKIFGFVNQIFGPKNPMPANMAGFTTMDTQQQQGNPPTSAELYNALPPQERANFDQACYVLIGNDPQIGTNLLKLANLLQNNPSMYQALTKMAT